MQRWRHSEAEFRGNLKNPISQLSVFRRGGGNKNWILPASKSRKTRGWEEIFCPFLAFFARIWLWKLDSGQVLFEKAEIFCQAKFCIPTNGRRGIKLNPLCGIFALRPHAINHPWNITYQIAKHSLVIRILLLDHKIQSFMHGFR